MSGLRTPRSGAMILLALVATTLAPTGPAQATPTTLPAQAVADNATRQARAITPGPAVRSVASLALGPYHIVNVRSGKCLTINGVSTANNASAVQYTCDNTAPYNEDWLLDDLSVYNNYFHIRNRHSNLCLTIRGASVSNNAQVVQYTCDYTAPYNEEWYLEDLSPYNTHLHIRNRHSALCLTVRSASIDNDALAVQYTCDYTAPYNEEWQIL